MNTIGFYKGDARSEFMAKYLADKYIINKHKTSEELFDNSDIIVTPVSLFINNDIEVNEFCKYISCKNTVFGGCFPDKLVTYFNKNNIKFYDYMKNEEFVLYNTVSTAEGVIEIAIANTDVNLSESNILIIGYGRCAKTLIRKMDGLCDNIWVTARKECDLFNAKLFGHESLCLDNLAVKINDFNIIINTVPAFVLDEDILKNVKNDALIIDIASKPGGVDFNYCNEHDIKAIHALGLPGKYSPKSTALFLCKLLLKALY